MKETLYEIVTSKKAIMAVVSAIVYLTGRLHWNVDPTAMLGAVTPLWLYVAAQALADHGKSAAQIQAKTAAAELAAALAAAQPVAPPQPKAAP